MAYVGPVGSLRSAKLHTLNVSTTSAFIETADTFDNEAMLDVRLELSESIEVDLVGVVRRRQGKGPAGIGVEFLRAGAQDHKTLTRFLLYMQKLVDQKKDMTK